MSGVSRCSKAIQGRWPRCSPATWRDLPRGRKSRTRRPFLLARSVIAAIGLLVVAVACSPVEQAAVTLDSRTGNPALVLSLCAGEGVSSVELQELDNEGEPRKLLWRVESASAITVERVVVGQALDSFSTEIALEQTLEANQSLRLTAALEGGMAATANATFAVGELKAGQLLRHGVPITSAELDSVSSSNCDTEALGLRIWIGIFAAIFVFLVLPLLVAARRSWRRESAPAAQGRT